MMRKLTYKTICLCCLLAGMLLILAACGGQKNITYLPIGTEQTTAQPAEQTTAQPVDQTTAQPAGQTADQSESGKDTQAALPGEREIDGTVQILYYDRTAVSMTPPGYTGTTGTPIQLLKPSPEVQEFRVVCDNRLLRINNNYRSADMHVSRDGSLVHWTWGPEGESWIDVYFIKYPEIALGYAVLYGYAAGGDRQNAVEVIHEAMFEEEVPMETAEAAAARWHGTTQAKRGVLSRDGEQLVENFLELDNNTKRLTFRIDPQKLLRYGIPADVKGDVLLSREDYGNLTDSVVTAKSLTNVRLDGEFESRVRWEVMPEETGVKGVAYLDLLVREKGSDRIVAYAVIRIIGKQDTDTEPGGFTYAAVHQAVFVDTANQYCSVSREEALEAAAFWHQFGE